MTFKEYMDQASRTMASLDSKQLDNLHLIMGIIDEEIEFIDKPSITEYGDIWWYLINYCRLNEIEVKAVDYGISHNQCLMDMLGSHKKELAYGKEIDWNLMTKTIQNYIFYLLNLAEKYDINVSEALEVNIKKLKVRFPDKFDAELAINKDEDEENKKIVNNERI